MPIPGLIRKARRNDPYGHMVIQGTLDHMRDIQAPGFEFPRRARREDRNGFMIVQDNLWLLRDHLLGINTNPFPKRARRDDPLGTIVVQDMIQYLGGLI